MPNWYVHTPDGQRHGPVDKSKLDHWVAQGRVPAGCQVFAEGWKQWRRVEDVYPNLAQPPAPPQNFTPPRAEPTPFQQQGITTQPGETPGVSNLFGTVTSKRVIFFSQFGWFSGRSRQDLPIRHVTSVEVVIWRNLKQGLIALGIALLLFAAVGTGDPAAIAFGILGGIAALAYAIIMLWGFPYVRLNTTGTDLTTTRGWPWQAAAAEEFAEALRAQLFRE